MKSLSPSRLLATPWTGAYQAPPPMGFFQARVISICSYYKHIFHPVLQIPITYFKIQIKIYLLSILIYSDYDYTVFLISTIWAMFRKHDLLIWAIFIVIDMKD